MTGKNVGKKKKNKNLTDDDEEQRGSAALPFPGGVRGRRRPLGHAAAGRFGGDRQLRGRSRYERRSV